MITVAEARAFVLSACRTLGPGRLPANDASGYVLAESVHAPEDVPPFTNSAMDGYAVRAEDSGAPPTRLRVTGTVMAGDDPGQTVGAGESVRIMTGAPLPAGADAVCMVEHTHTEDDGAIVVLEQAVGPGTNVRRAGEDVVAGAEVFGPRTLLGPAHVGVLASLGVATVVVFGRPAVGVLSTGDELAAAGGPLAPGKIRDANRPALLAQLRADGFAPVDLGIAEDEEAVVGTLVEDAAARCDAVVTSGGVSVGDRDVMKAVLLKIGGTRARSMQVAVKPAKPLAFGTLGERGTPAFGLPGNPVSALVAYELFVRPALRTMAGHRAIDRPRLAAVAETDLDRRRDGKLHLLRVALRTGTDGVPRARPSGGQGSHMLRAMAGADALALLPDGEGVRRGDRVEVLVLDADGLCTPDTPAEW